jgi:ubiquinone/menaquinone biosynthesis C-methylase UbiE
MFPIYKSKYSIFNYDDIPPGYYFKAMLEGSSVQRYWHRMKFQSVINYISDNDTVLDFGCGPGSFLHLLGKSDKNIAEGIGIDVSSNQIKFAMDHVGVQFPYIKFVELDSDEVRFPFPDQKFDIITIIEVIEHIHPFILSNTINELKRCLNKDGRMIFTTPNYRSLWPFIEFGLNKVSRVKYHAQHINKYTPNAFIKFLETMGLEIVSLKSIFIISPFLAGISTSLANVLFNLENKIMPVAGSLLVAETKIKSFE